MSLGTLLPLLGRSGAAVSASALLVGGSFMVATMAGLQLARTLAPHNPTPLLGRMTAAFALGQIAGPLLVRLLDSWLAPRRAGPDAQAWGSIELTSVVAGALLAATAAWLWRYRVAAAADSAPR
jgi:hypothetical protein